MPTTTKKVASKKAVKKVATKKVASKKTSTKKAARQKVLVYADNARSFWVHDGQILNSLEALYDVLNSMEKEIFSHHVSKEKNDFADWVSAVLCDETCAADLRNAKTPRSARLIVATHLKQYQR